MAHLPQYPQMTLSGTIQVFQETILSNCSTTASDVKRKEETRKKDSANVKHDTLQKSCAQKRVRSFQYIARIFHCAVPKISSHAKCKLIALCSKPSSLASSFRSQETNHSKSGQLLDIVIAHHNEWNEGQVRTFWEDFLNLPKVVLTNACLDHIVSITKCKHCGSQPVNYGAWVQELTKG